MKNSVPDRFAVIRSLREDRQSETLLVNDNLLGHCGVVLRIIAKGHFQCDRDQLVAGFSWLIGTRHSQLATVLDAGLTKQSDLYYVREYLPPSELLSFDPLVAI